MMKYAMLVGDGMSDRPLSELGDKTPLEVAKIPNINDITRHGMIGSCKTIPKGMAAASDVANLSIMGYDPKRYYTGRGPLEAANMGIELDSDEIAFRCNLITYNNTVLADYSAGHITDKESSILMNYVNEKLGTDRIRFYHGKSYRNLAVIKAKSQDELNDLTNVVCVPPHDIIGKEMLKHLPNGRGADLLIKIMEESKDILKNHEINKVRVDLKENPANMLWLWGQGTNPHMPSFKGLFGIDGAVISAVDLVNGIGKLIGLETVKVPGATGYYDTNYQGKGEYAVGILKKKDFVFVHVEAPDEAGHNGDVREKVTAIENFDKFVVGAVWRRFKELKDYRIMVLSDHSTPISVRTHVSDPVPFVMAGKGIEYSGLDAFNENSAVSSKVKYSSGPLLAEAFFKI